MSCSPTCRSAWAGDHYLNYCAGSGRRLLHGLSGKLRHGDGRSARNRADLLFRAAAHARTPAHAGDDPHGGCRLPQAQAVPLFHRRRAQIRRTHPQRPVGAARRPAALWIGQYPGLRPAQERARLFARARGLYRGRGDRARPVHVLPLDRTQSEAALRPDRSRYLYFTRSRTARSIPTRSARLVRMSISASPRTAKCSSSRLACLPAISRTTQRPPKR